MKSPHVHRERSDDEHLADFIEHADRAGTPHTKAVARAVVRLRSELSQLRAEREHAEHADVESEVFSYLREVPSRPGRCRVIESQRRVAVLSRYGHELWHLYTKKRKARSAPLADWTFDDLTPACKGTSSEAQATKWVVDGKWGEP
jgi:hypothetical protein